MGQTTEILFATNSYQARSGIMSSERLVNMYAEANPKKQRNANIEPFRGAIYGTPGTTIWVDFTTLATPNFNSIFGSTVMGGDLYVVCGLTVYKIDTSKTVTTLGTLATTPGRVMMTHNRTQVTILTISGDSWVATSSTLAKITDVNYQSASSVTTIDGYTVFSKTETDIFFISALNDSTTYAALDVATAEYQVDNLVAVYSFNNYLWLLGENTIEIWYNSGNVLFPFERVDGIFIDVGCGARFSVASDEFGGIFWLGNDNIVYRATSSRPIAISTAPISKAIEGYSITNDAFGTFYVQEGHRFYALTFPAACKTWVYDVTTDLWHERESRNPDTSAAEEWLTNSLSYFTNLNIVGDKNTGRLYELDMDVFEENGTTIIREAIAGTVFKNFSRTATNRFTLIMDTGVGIDGSGQGTDPEIMLSSSRDGGKTFPYEEKQKIGKIGNSETEVFWTLVDWGRSLILKINISDPIKVAITAAYINQKIGGS